jgi:hypothetical protein
MHVPTYKKAASAPPRARVAPPTAIVVVAASTSVRPLSPPGKQLGTFPRTRGSWHSHLFPRIRPPLTGTRAGAEAPPWSRCRRPPAASPTQPTPRIDHWWAQSPSCAACAPPPATVRRRWTHPTAGGHCCEHQGHSYESRDLVVSFWILVS